MKENLKEVVKELRELRDELNGVDRWRAPFYDDYYYLTNYFEVVKTIEDDSLFDRIHHDKGNYFKTRELAEDVANKIMKLLLTTKHS